MSLYKVESKKEKELSKYNKIENELIEKEKLLIEQQNILDKEEFQKRLTSLSNNVQKYRSDKKLSVEELNKFRMDKTKEILEQNKLIQYRKITNNDKVAKVSIVGAGMVATPGVTYKMFRTLAEDKINILAISTSEIKISVIIDEQLTIQAVKKLHKTFNLD